MMRKHALGLLVGLALGCDYKHTTPADSGSAVEEEARKGAVDEAPLLEDRVEEKINAPLINQPQPPTGEELVEQCFTLNLRRRTQDKTEDSPKKRTHIKHHRVSRFDSIIQREAAKQGIDAAIVYAVIMSESGGVMSIKNGQGSNAMGIGQIMPGTAKQYGLKVNSVFKLSYDNAHFRMRMEGGKKWAREKQDLYLVEQLHERDDRVNPTKALPVTVRSLAQGYRRSKQLYMPQECKDADISNDPMGCEDYEGKPPKVCRDKNVRNDLHNCEYYEQKAEKHAIMYYYYPTSIKKGKQSWDTFRKRRRAALNYFERVSVPLGWVRSESYVDASNASFEEAYGMSLDDYKATCEGALNFVSESDGFPYLVSTKREPKKKK